MEQPAAVVPEYLRRLFALVDGQIVEDEHCARLQLGSQDLLDVGIEGIPVHGAGQHPWRDQPVLGQSGDQGLVAAVAEGGLPGEAMTLQTAPMGAGHARIGPGLIKEHKALGMLAHHRLATFPFAPCLLDVKFVAFLRDEPFFYMCTRAA